MLLVLVGLLLYSFSPADYRLWPKCPFRLLTGLNCPACGIQRFLHAFSHGRVREAVGYNYYLVYALPYTLCVLTAYFLPQSHLKERLTGIFEGKVAVGIYVVSFCVWFVVRNVCGL